MAPELAFAFLATAQQLPLGPSDDRPFTNKAVAAIEDGEAPGTTERVAGVCDRQLELGAALRIAAAVADTGVVLWGIEAGAI
jgi:hypothetical protein